jgi:hypothetical protein
MTLYYLEVFLDPHGEYSHILSSKEKVIDKLKQYSLEDNKIKELMSSNHNEISIGTFVHDTFKYIEVDSVDIT